MTQPVSRVDRFERRTEWPLAVLALVFLIAYAVPILRPEISPSWRHVCTVTDYVIWMVFVVEFLTRVMLAERRVHYAARHVADVLMVALPLLRPLRLLRFLVLLRMINRRATASLHGRIAMYVVSSAGLVLLISALAMLDAERQNPQANIKTFGDALWWAVTTMSTVGYGDRFPTTSDGRYIGAGLMVAGVALLGVVTATLASWLIAQVRKVESEAQTATRRPARRGHRNAGVVANRASAEGGKRNARRDSSRHRRTSGRDCAAHPGPPAAPGRQRRLVTGSAHAQARVRPAPAG